MKSIFIAPCLGLLVGCAALGACATSGDEQDNDDGVGLSELYELLEITDEVIEEFN